LILVSNRFPVPGVQVAPDSGAVVE
ncbi:MAG: hypothetical protein QOH53_375, partial [Ilumatobacteraceae bacterium]